MVSLTVWPNGGVELSPSLVLLHSAGRRHQSGPLCSAQKVQLAPGAPGVVGVETTGGGR